MSKHTQSILLFGLVLPGLVVGILLSIALVGRGKLVAQKELKEKEYEEFQTSAQQLSAIEEELSVEGRSDQMEYWEAELKKEFIQSLTQNLNEITSQFSEDQLIRTELSRPGTRSPIAGVTDNPHSRFKLSFEGGFGPMQIALAELEMRMPHLVLEGLDIQPVRENSGRSSRLHFDATYLAWHDISEQERH